jgi:hypothetical protein
MGVLLGADDGRPGRRPASPARESTEQYRGDVLDLLHRLAEASGETRSEDVEAPAQSAVGLLFGLSVNWLCTGDDDLFRRPATDAALSLAARLTGQATARC